MVKKRSITNGLGLGKKGERLAARYLQKKGYRIIERSYRCAIGEIDIVAKKGGYLVFVEVKTRNDERFGKPFESVDKRKQAKIIKVADLYYSYLNDKDLTCRFDVVSIESKANGYLLDHIENAFE